MTNWGWKVRRIRLFSLISLQLQHRTHRAVLRFALRLRLAPQHSPFRRAQHQVQSHPGLAIGEGSPPVTRKGPAVAQACRGVGILESACKLTVERANGGLVSVTKNDAGHSLRLDSGKEMMNQGGMIQPVLAHQLD